MTETNSDTGMDICPQIPFRDALELCKKIKDMGGRVQPSTLAKTMNKKYGGWFGIQMASLRRWGLVEGRGEMQLTPLYKRIIAPNYEGDDLKAKQEAFLSVPLFKNIYDKYREHGLPKDEYFSNALANEYNLNDRNRSIVSNIVRTFIAENFPRYGEQSIKEDTVVQSQISEKKPEGNADPFIPTPNLEGFEVELRITGKYPLKLIIEDETDWEVVEKQISAAKEKWKKQHITD